MRFTRYAVYFTPPPGPLAAFGAAWLGWDSAQGRRVMLPPVAGLPVPLSEITATPRKYGLHATLMAPFNLSDGYRHKDLQAALAGLGQRLSPVMLDALALRRIGGFLALAPQGETAALNLLAARVVRDLQPLRAPVTEQDLARRRSPGLTPRQDALLQEWGYPYVMEEFRFHITLTGTMTTADLDRVEAVLSPLVMPLVPRPFPIGDLTLSGEDSRGMFHDIQRYRLAG